jgi:hypothetical protein
VTADWGLKRLDVQALRAAVLALLGDFTAAYCLDLVRLAEARAADRSARPVAWGRESRLTAEGVATAFSLSLRRQAALIELRWAALAETRAERLDHLAHAAMQLADCIRQEAQVDDLAADIAAAPSCGVDLAAPPAPSIPPARPVTRANPTDGDAA